MQYKARFLSFDALHSVHVAAWLPGNQHPVISAHLSASQTEECLYLPPHQLQVLEYIDEAMPPETPLAFGLHPNAEIGFKLREAERFCANVLCLQPREAGGEGGMSTEEKAKMVSWHLHDSQCCSNAC